MVEPNQITSVRDTLVACRPLFWFAAMFGVALNALMLAGPLYMLQIYDRVLTSGSVQTLITLTILVVFAYVAYGFIDDARSRVAAKAGLRIERLLSEKLVRSAWTDQKPASIARSTDLLKDVDVFRGFVGGPGVTIATDLPFAPMFIFVIFMLHPLLGVFATFSILLLVILALATQALTRRKSSEAREAAQKNARRVIDVARAGETVRVLGLATWLTALWRGERDDVVSKQAAAGDRGSSFKSATKATRFAVQSLILGVGAWLVLQNEISPGAMIAASIVLTRALSPIEQALGSWSQYHAARSARANIDEALAGDAPERFASSKGLTPITGRVRLDGLGYTSPGMDKPLFSNITLDFGPGKTIGVIGPSGSGKTTLARILVGALAPSAGCVRFDGADVRTLDPEWLGPQIGFLSQDAPMLSGTVLQNIARFRPSREVSVIEAARRARAHELIQGLPAGYDTHIGEGGVALSAGQRQRIAFARALFGAPRFVVLDEPDANLDEVGRAALQDALEELSDSGVTTVMVTHNFNLLESVETVFAINAAGAVIFGPRNLVLERLGMGVAGESQQKQIAGPTTKTVKKTTPAKDPKKKT